MRIILSIVLFISLRASATNYYFSNTGVDGNNGTSAATPKQTAAAFAAVSAAANTGDWIYFNRGDTFRGYTVTSGNSGLSFGAYGTGADPIVTGFQQLTSWTNVGTNLWEAPCNSGLNLDLVQVGSITVPAGRSPNAGFYWNINSHTNVSGSSATITSDSIKASWVGAEAIVRVNEYNLDRNIVTARSSTTLTYTTVNTTHNIDHDGQKFFIQKHPNTLDQQNEWYYNSTTHVLRMYSTSNPSGLNVQAATTDYFYYVQYRNNMAFQNIKFTGYDSIAIRGLNPYFFNIVYNTFEDIGTDAISFDTDSSCNVNYNNFNRIGNTGIVARFSHKITITNNIIDSCGLVYGMGLSNNQQRDGILVEVLNGSYKGKNTTITDNIISNVGYCGITWSGELANVQRNYVQNYGMVDADGGAFYTCCYNGFATRSTVKNNVAINGYGRHDMGTSPYNGGMPGIYLDDNTGDHDLDSNVIINSTGRGIYLHNAVNINVRGNTIYQTNSTNGIDLEDDNLGGQVRGIRITGNEIYVSPTANVMQLRSDLNDYSSMGSFSHNRFARSTTGNMFNTIGNVTASYTLASWKSTFGWDQQTEFIQVNDDSVRIEPNTGAASKYVLLNATYSNFSGTPFYNNVPIPAYRALLLYRKTIGSMRTRRPVKFIP